MLDTQDQDIEQEALILDKEWERIQIKTFTAWTNSFLRKRGVQIDNILTDFRDGKKLSILLEIISNESLGPLEKGKLRVHYISNVNKCLKFIANKGVKLIGIGSEEIVDGNEKMTLGMIWTIILRFSLQGIEEGMSAKDGLLLWCQRQLKPYDNVNVQNFTSSWKNGLAFNALIHRHRPELIDYTPLTSSNAKHNLENAFKVAEDSLDIPRMLDSDDVINFPDEKSIITYVSCFYRLFSKNHEFDSAVKRLKNSLDQIAEYEKLRDQFESMASDLINWIKSSTNEQQDRIMEDDSLDYFNNLLKRFIEYNSNVKPPKAKEKNAIQSHLNTLQTLLRVKQKEPYIPPEHLNMSKINELWKILSEEERKRLDWIKNNLRRHRSIAHLVKKFNHKCSLAEDFLKSNQSSLSVDESNQELTQLIARQRKHEVLQSEIVSRKKRLTQIDDIYNQLNDLKYSKINDCTQRLNLIKNEMDTFENKCSEVTIKIENLVKIAKKLDSLRLDFSQLSGKFKTLCDGLIDDCDGAYVVDCVDDVLRLQEEHKKTQESFIEVKNLLSQCADLDREIKNINSSPNPYSSNTITQMEQSYKKLIDLADAQTASLDKDLELQKRNEQINMKLKTFSQNVIQWQLEEKEKVIKLTGTLEVQKQQLTKFENEVVSYHEPKLIELQNIVKEINEHNTGADRSMIDNVESGYHELTAIISSAQNAIENQILIRDSSHLTEEQLNEIKETFQKMDKHKLNFLGIDDFRNFLIAMGYNVTPNDPNGEKEFKNILGKCDPNEIGHVTLSSYLNYVAESNQSKDSTADIIASFKIIAEGKPYITLSKIKSELPDHYERCAMTMKPYKGDGAPHDALDYNTYSESLYSGADI